MFYRTHHITTKGDHDYSASFYALRVARQHGETLAALQNNRTVTIEQSHNGDVWSRCEVLKEHPGDLNPKPKTTPEARTLPPDPEDLNNERAEWADTALGEFEAESGSEDGDSFADLLCDLRHLADRKGLDWNAELARAMQHYTEETAG